MRPLSATCAPTARPGTPKRPAAPFLCTYTGRASKTSATPFRFILNRSAANVYLLLYPKEPLRAALAADEALFERVWGALGELSAEELVREGRVYGGGLHKLEPKELANTPARRLADLIPGFGEPPKRSEQVGLFEVVSVR